MKKYLFLFLFLFPAVAFGQTTYLDPIHVDLNGGPSVSVIPGADIYMTVDAYLYGGNDFESLSWKIGDGDFSCHKVGDFRVPQKISIEAPDEPGSYDITIQVQGIVTHSNVGKKTADKYKIDPDCSSDTWAKKTFQGILKVRAPESEEPVSAAPTPEQRPVPPTREEVRQIIETVVQVIEEPAAGQSDVVVEADTASSSQEEVIASSTPAAPVVQGQALRSLVERIVEAVFSFFGWR